MTRRRTQATSRSKRKNEATRSDDEETNDNHHDDEIKHMEKNYSENYMIMDQDEAIIISSDHDSTPSRRRSTRQIKKTKLEDETEEIIVKKQETSSGKKGSKSGYANQVARLFYKNSVLNKINLEDIFSYDIYKMLSEKNQKYLTQFLVQDIDVDEQGFAKRKMFLDPNFKASISEFESLLSEGYLNTSKKFKEVIENVIEVNQKKGYVEEGMENYWLSNADKIETSWVKNLED
ncbi:hypothetical protein FDP41_010303 [Naegleria fowleri]|uniref:ASX DEUBAD domain-containing protein n=1 Tax=Naegleria fowleri TaxID=5763 RepID=A0A6A5CCH5_NAEFO|nr:uncharacterized protein FDP41_010303 [Naegleria fowleri]KAF0983238.1 hypothetical protein FDP41_010303 [Naegleria fowleri]CAG4712737.1 unnamed protein product [Naegleria fowleri]